MYVNVTRLGTAGKATRAWFVVDGKGNFLGGAVIVRLTPLPLAGEAGGECIGEVARRTCGPPPPQTPPTSGRGKRLYFSSEGKRE
jgi:hypothetical protein